ncbi:hypothetical protein OF83DRAFT_914390 [Amylostereum chailletii]|nr:hypothetical protein OF83DRAFT_914390 [Amylostereum chailletii]
MSPSRHTRAPSRTDSLLSDSSTNSTLVDSMDIPFYPDGEHVMMHLDYVLPVTGDDLSIPSCPSSIMLPEEPMAPSPASSSHFLLLPSSSAGSKPRLWLQRKRRSTSPNLSMPTDHRASLLNSLFNARWPKSEPEDPIFGQTTPRALSPFRGQPTAPLRPHSTQSMPRSILRSDSRAGMCPSKPQRSLGSVKFAKSAGVRVYSCMQREDSDFDEGYGAGRIDAEEDAPGKPNWYQCRAAREREKAKDADTDSMITYPPPRERQTRNESFLRRLMTKSNKQEKCVSGPGKLVISAPMPLARAASLREMKEASRSKAELATAAEKKKKAKAKKSPELPPVLVAEKSTKSRSFWGRRAAGS